MIKGTEPVVHTEKLCGYDRLKVEKLYSLEIK